MIARIHIRGSPAERAIRPRGERRASRRGQDPEGRVVARLVRPMQNPIESYLAFGWVSMTIWIVLPVEPVPPGDPSLSATSTTRCRSPSATNPFSATMLSVGYSADRVRRHVRSAQEDRHGLLRGAHDAADDDAVSVHRAQAPADIPGCHIRAGSRGSKIGG